MGLGPAAILYNTTGTSIATLTTAPVGTELALIVRNIPSGTQFIDWLTFTKVDSNNSTAAPLGAGATFTGVATDASGFSTVFGTVFVDQPGNLTMQESSDGVHWDVSATAPIPITPAGQAMMMSHSIMARYIRLS